MIWKSCHTTRPYIWLLFLNSLHRFESHTDTSISYNSLIVNLKEITWSWNFLGKGACINSTKLHCQSFIIIFCDGGHPQENIGFSFCIKIYLNHYWFSRTKPIWRSMCHVFCDNTRPQGSSGIWRAKCRTYFALWDHQQHFVCMTSSEITFSRHKWRLARNCQSGSTKRLTWKLELISFLSKLLLGGGTLTGLWQLSFLLH